MDQGAQAPPGAARGGATPPGRLGAWWGPLAPLWASGRFLCADFLYNFPRIFGALLIRGKSEMIRQQKRGTGTVVH